MPKACPTQRGTPRRPRPTNRWQFSVATPGPCNAALLPKSCPAKAHGARVRVQFFLANPAPRRWEMLSLNVALPRADVRSNRQLPASAHRGPRPRTAPSPAARTTILKQGDWKNKQRLAELAARRTNENGKRCKPENLTGKRPNGLAARNPAETLRTGSWEYARLAAPPSRGQTTWRREMGAGPPPRRAGRACGGEPEATSRQQRRGAGAPGPAAPAGLPAGPVVSPGEGGGRCKDKYVACHCKTVLFGARGCLV